MLSRAVRRIWEPVVEQDSMQECKDFIKGGGVLDSNNNKPLQFVRHPSTPGNDRVSMFKCASHKDCPVLAKGVKKGGTFWVHITADVEHSTEVLEKPRANSMLGASAR